MQRWTHKRTIPYGFTIVELLIVIVVIAILATIAIVAYNGITARSKLGVLQSDLTNAASQLGIDNVNTGVYPATAAAANNGAGLKASPGTTWQYTYTAGTNSYCLTGTNSGVSYYISSDSGVAQAGACPGDINGGGGGGGIADGSPIQTITSANCPTTRTRAVDARDNHTYWVQKLADGKCWMLTNLAYAGGGTNTYSDTKTLTNSPSSTFTVPGYYIPTSGANVTSEPTAPSTSTSGTGQYGYLYNWCGAMGGQATAACANASIPTPDPSISVCPSGWRLPTGNGGEYTGLNTALNGGSTSDDSGLRNAWLGQWSGYWSGGSFGAQGSAGSYWSSSLSADAFGYRLYLSSSLVGPAYSVNKTTGIAVRCIAI
jgi:uncharacterized protein (TIGR02145 family)/prepilin-type N-terminal cleavage/methylation domain-containing protein